MTPEPAISLRGVSIRFRRRHRKPRALWDQVVDTVSTPRRAETFDALQGIDLQVAPGTRLGLVGSNGAGKTTLLRVIAGIYSPTAGQRQVTGRIACFLQPGVGIAPSLSVVENARLHGVLVGIPWRELRGRLDEVLELSNLTDFRDARLEQLSWGMQQRLFFAVAAQAIGLGRADVFLFDETLAGGDATFRAKADAILKRLLAAGQTVVFASHGLEDLLALCDRALLLSEGRIVADGTAPEVVARYRATASSP